MFVAPFRAEVGCGPVCGWTVSSVVERTVVHAVGPGRLVGLGVERGQELRARRLLPHGRRAAAAAQAAGRTSVVPCCVPAAASTSVTFARRLGQ